MKRRGFLLLACAKPEKHRYVPLGEGLYANKKQFLRINSLMDRNEKDVYDQFIANDRRREWIQNPNAFIFRRL